MADQPEAKSSHPESSVSSQAVPTAVVAPNPVVVQHNSGGKGMALGALVLSLLALGAGGLLFVQGQNTFKNLETNVNHKIDQAKVGEVDALLAMKTTQESQKALSQQLQQLQQDNQRLNQQLVQIDQVYQQLVKSRHQWLLDEIEFSLNVATQQLLLTGNKEAAIKSLRSIENRLNQFNRPELIPLKQAISADLIALTQGTSNVNVTSTAVMLSSLEGRVDGLKTLLESTLTQPELMKETINENAPWWENVWGDVKNSFRGLVEVRKLDNKDAMLIAPEQSEYLRENIRLHLVSARIALMQQQSELYANELQTVESAVRRYYDLEHPLTKAWLSDLAKVQQVQLGGNLGDSLKNSLAAVQAYQQKNPSEASILTLPLPQTAASAPEATQDAKPAAASEPKAAVPEKSESKPAPKAASAPQGGQA